jgi:hypothetical protein
MTKLKNMLCCAVLAALAAPAHAAVLSLSADGSWNSFTIADQLSLAGDTSWIALDGASLTYSFTIPQNSIGTLTVVDSVLAGDRFAVTNNGSLLGLTSSVAQTTYNANTAPVFDYDAALADAAFSRGVFTLGAGSYLISGSLVQSVMLDASTPLNSTDGALKLNVTAVPAPAALISLVSGLSTLGLAALRRKA